MDGLNGLNDRARRLLGRLGGLQEHDPAYDRRYAYFRPLMQRYASSLSPREHEAAAHRLAACRETAVDRIRAHETARRIGAGPEPESVASRERNKLNWLRYKAWRLYQGAKARRDLAAADHHLQRMGRLKRLTMERFPVGPQRA